MSDHREFLFDVGGAVMDLRHDIMFAETYTHRYPSGKIVSRLIEIEYTLAQYADEQLKQSLPGWEVPAGDF